MKQVLAFVLVAVAFSLLGASVYRAATTPWTAGDTFAALTDVTPQKAEPVNHLYAPQLTADAVRRASKIVLHLDGIHATTEVDTVRVLLLVTVSGQEIQADVARLTLNFSGKPQSQAVAFDVTEEFTGIKDAAPSNFLVAFVVRGPNQSAPMDQRAFEVDQTYFELVDSDGHAVLP